MDKNTLSNYGWIVIAVLVLSVMIALATPLGSFIEQGVRSTITGLFDTSEKAMNVVGMTGGDGNFEDGYQFNNKTPKELTTVSEKVWTGLTRFDGEYIWTDGTNTYYSRDYEQYVLNGDTWEEKTWTGLTNINGIYVWTDGTNTYYSSGTTHYVLNGDIWETKTWTGLTSFNGTYIWTDGTNTYYSRSTTHYVLNGDTWEKKTWNGFTSFDGDGVWTDGINFYYSKEYTHYVFS